MGKYSIEDVDNILAKDIVEERPAFFKKYIYDGSAKGKRITAKDGISFPKYSLCYEGVQFAPRGGLHVVTGQSGNGKTMLNSVLMAAYLSGEYIGVRRNFDDTAGLKVLFVDTEQEEENSKLVRARVHEMVGWDINTDSDYFRAISTIEADNAQKHIEMILNEVEDFHPDVLFLDGLMDLIDAMNDEEKSRILVNELTRIARFYQMNIWCVLHQNPNDKKMAGHLGSFLERKCTDVLAIKYNNKEKCFEVRHGKARAGHIQTLYFELGTSKYNYGKNTWKLPKSMARMPKKEEPEIDKTEEESDKDLLAPKEPEAVQTTLSEDDLNKKVPERGVGEIIGKFFYKIGDALSVNKLENAIKKECHYGTEKARKIIADAEAKRIISKESSPNGNGNVYVYQFFTNSDDGELPF